MEHKIYKVSAFTKEGKGGNLAGVVLAADSLNDREMQSIAKRLGYSETAFVQKSEKADFKVRFFTPTDEVDLCGHATIATFNLLKTLKYIKEGIYKQETKAGILQLNITSDLVYMEQNPPRFFEKLLVEDLMHCFDKLNVDTKYPIQIVSTGMKEIFLPVKTKLDLHQLTPHFERIIELSKKYDVIGIHAFTYDCDVDAESRNFAPLVGIDEESATGTSNGALGCYTYQYKTQKEQYLFWQGISMNLPSEITTKIQASGNQIDRVYVGGKAIVLEEIV